MKVATTLVGLATVTITTTVTTARADLHDHVTGYTAHAGPLTGHVTDAHGQPIANATVHVATRAGERLLHTDARGRYATTLDGDAMIFLRDMPDAHIEGETSAATRHANTEDIDVRAMEPPATVAKSHTRPGRIPDWSDDAIDSETWIKAWMLLDISATGHVDHVKFVQRPGHGLDDIARDFALHLQFDPALDRGDHPVRSLLLYPLEWPPYLWLSSTHNSMYWLPPEAAAVPCTVRDCRPPDLAHSVSEPWVAASKASAPAPARPRP